MSPWIDTAKVVWVVHIMHVVRPWSRFQDTHFHHCVWPVWFCAPLPTFFCASQWVPLTCSCMSSLPPKVSFSLEEKLKCSNLNQTCHSQLTSFFHILVRSISKEEGFQIIQSFLLLWPGQACLLDKSPFCFSFQTKDGTATLAVITTDAFHHWIWRILPRQTMFMIFPRLLTFSEKRVIICVYPPHYTIRWSPTISSRYHFRA